MFGIFTYIYHKHMSNVGKDTIHGVSGKAMCHLVRVTRKQLVYMSNI